MNTDQTNVYNFKYANKIADFTMLELYMYSQYDGRIFFLQNSISNIKFILCIVLLSGL